MCFDNRKNIQLGNRQNLTYCCTSFWQRFIHFFNSVPGDRILYNPYNDKNENKDAEITENAR